MSGGGGVFLNCPELPGGGVWEQMLYIWKSPKGKIPHIWHFWNIKIPTPPFISSLKIGGLMQFVILLCPLQTNYNPYSLLINPFRQFPKDLFFRMRRLPLKVTQLINLVNCFRNESWFRKYPYNSLCFLASRMFEAQVGQSTHVPWQQSSIEHSAAAGAAGTLTCWRGAHQVNRWSPGWSPDDHQVNRWSQLGAH